MSVGVDPGTEIYIRIYIYLHSNSPLQKLIIYAIEAKFVWSSNVRGKGNHPYSPNYGLQITVFFVIPGPKSAIFKRYVSFSDCLNFE